MKEPAVILTKSCRKKIKLDNDHFLDTIYLEENIWYGIRGLAPLFGVARQSVQSLVTTRVKSQHRVYVSWDHASRGTYFVSPAGMRTLLVNLTKIGKMNTENLKYYHKILSLVGEDMTTVILDPNNFGTADVKPDYSMGVYYNRIQSIHDNMYYLTKTNDMVDRLLADMEEIQSRGETYGQPGHTDVGMAVTSALRPMQFLKIELQAALTKGPYSVALPDNLTEISYTLLDITQFLRLWTVWNTPHVAFAKAFADSLGLLPRSVRDTLIYSRTDLSVLYANIDKLEKKPLGDFEEVIITDATKITLRAYRYVR